MISEHLESTLSGFICKSCNIYIMDLIENVALVLSGFITTLVSMEVGWRLASRQTNKKSVSSSKQEVRRPQWTV